MRDLPIIQADFYTSNHAYPLFPSNPGFKCGDLCSMGWCRVFLYDESTPQGSDLDIKSGASDSEIEGAAKAKIKAIAT
jgi:hypothetical protein